ncbi:RnfABCDGE type electron transport complex subunit B [candidate division KSB3 bacterium]|uniref:Ion-translocating oxidoreductase complex subunit B n=1 Tax=candidate division KSB3 bacterium TaxID=2044937 RepID=A0A9D5K0E2_9BACT|nr:RnfABCDGE type electron transport complex subunit B [candidate division KSB3 bacterium]MBD3327306.1 RnfABCDGE type electron transport complex subunit B [candidate division KSB3 bacterium]
MTTILLAILSMGVLCFLFAFLLAMADRKLRVEEDPRVSKVLEVLPNINCGGCGYPGCSAFAEHVVAGDAPISGCAPGGPETRQKIAEIMGVEVSDVEEKQVAVVLCHGGIKEAVRSAVYNGVKTCRSAVIIGGGGKLCQYGCLGYGDCVASCPFDAIHMNDNQLPVVDPEKCTACGNCVRACPRNLIELHPVSHQMFVFCKSQDKGPLAKKACSVGCIACRICTKQCPVEHGITMNGNLAAIDYDICPPSDVVVEKCPMNTIQIVDLNA